MKKQAYIDFFLDARAKSGHKPLFGEMELTFRCPLHCQHCNTECYNNKNSIKNELSTEEIKLILKKCKKDGVIWFCFTGGDPLIRKDFAEIYLYAKKLGFIITIFTSLIPLDKKLLQILKNKPPFLIETTLNAATHEKYKEITKTNFFDKHINNINLLLDNNLPVRIKTQITKQNISQINKIKSLIESFGLEFIPSIFTFPRLNHDTIPCNLRIEPKEAAAIAKKYGYFEGIDRMEPKTKYNMIRLVGKPKDDKLLACPSWVNQTFWISPQGKLSFCCYLRKPNYDLLNKNHSIRKGFFKISSNLQSLNFKTKSKCRTCEYRLICKWCPGRAYLEKSSLEKPIGYFCKLTNQIIGQ